jgi:choline dehydrogenase-like flavoprotein
MLIEIAPQARGDLSRFDVCIVGSGPAGIAVARELCRAGLSVCLVESGAHKSSGRIQDLNAGVIDSAHGYREETLREGRCRRFGGTANLWNHQIRGEPARYVRYLPLDEIDFETRDWVPESGWPFARQAIEPFYEHAQQICGIKSFDCPPEILEAETKNERLWQTEKIESIVSQFGLAEIFVEHYRRELVRDHRVAIILRATLLHFQMDALSRVITSGQVGTPDGRKFWIRARTFVLAAGGLENSRILLLQEDLQSGGLGNQHDMVGRCFMDHPQTTLGVLIPFSNSLFGRVELYDQHRVGKQMMMRILHIRPEVMRREKMLNLCGVLVPHFKTLRENSPATLRQLMVRVPRFIYRRLSSQYRGMPLGAPPRPFRQRLLEDYYAAGQCGWSRLSRPERRFGRFSIRSLVEQSPDRSNRVMLQEETDEFDQRKIKVLWRWNNLDLRSIRQAQQIFREELASAGIGTFVPLEETNGAQPRRFDSAHHFLGTTRMHENPRNGVVDADCRVHGVANLFVAGSSVFPTGGYANPTFTIIALALRLANHLQSELRSKPTIDLHSEPGERQTSTG